MYLRTIGKTCTTYVYNEIAIITNDAILHFKKVEYDKEKQVVVIPIERFEVEIRRTFWRRYYYKNNKNVKIPSIITIRKITECEIKQTDWGPDFPVAHILFDVNIDPEKQEVTEITISSVEGAGTHDSEGRGVLFFLTAKVSEIDIEIRDTETIRGGLHS